MIPLTSSKKNSLQLQAQISNFQSKSFLCEFIENADANTLPPCLKNSQSEK